MTSVRDGTGGGGDVSVAARVVALDGGSILARAFAGPGGNIAVQSQALFATAPFTVNEELVAPGEGNGADIDATSNLGLSGQVDIAAPESDLIGKLERLPAAFLDASALLAGPCVARTERGGSFTVVRREGLPVPPDQALPPLSGREPGGAAGAEGLPPGTGCPAPQEIP